MAIQPTVVVCPAFTDAEYTGDASEVDPWLDRYDFDRELDVAGVSHPVYYATDTDLALAPTEGARANLRREGRDDATVLVTGNTGVDAVRTVAGRAPTPPLPGGTATRVTVTLHRRENLPHLAAFAAAIARVARAHPALAFVWPVHRNPAVREAVLPAIRDVPNVIAGDPLDYEAMVATLAASRLIVTDSGGLQEEGAALQLGGGRPTDPRFAGGTFLEPTVLTGLPHEGRVASEEIFGPVLTVETFRDDDEAHAFASSTRSGLAAGVFSRDAARAMRLAKRLRFGTVWINDFHPYYPEAPWGGFGESGIGRELGREGLAEYQETQHLYWNLEPAGADWFGPGD